MISIIGERIKTLRITRAMNQREFAQQAGISQPTLSCYEKGTALPSIEVLINIALKFEVSVDWLCGITKEEVSVSDLSDFIRILFEMDKASNLRYEIEVDDHLPNDLEDGARKWQAAIKFFGNDPAHPCNADICNFLSAFRDNRQAFESYFANKEQYLWWQKYMLDRYRKSVLAIKQYEDIPDNQRIALRNALVLREAQGSGE